MIITCSQCDEQWDSECLDNGEMAAWEVDALKAGDGCPSCESKGVNSGRRKPSDHIIGTCVGCGHVVSIDQDEIFYSEGKMFIPLSVEFIVETQFCSQCQATKTAKCYMCEVIVINEAIHSETTGRDYCIPCYENDVYVCVDCTTPIEPGSEYESDGDERYCATCFNAKWSRCATCGHIFASDTVHDRQCEKCTDNLL